MADMLGILRDLRQRTGVVTSNQGQNDIINTVGTGLLSQVLTTAVAQKNPSQERKKAD